MQLSRPFFPPPFKTCECAVMIKETGTLHFQYRTINGSQRFPSHPRQLRRFLILYLIWLYWMNLILQKLCVDGGLQVSSYTPPLINSETYTLFISAVFLSPSAYWFASIWHPPLTNNAWETITLDDRIAFSTAEGNSLLCKSLVFLHDLMKTTCTGKSNGGVSEN